MKSQMWSRPSFASAPKNIQLLYSLKQRVTVFSIEPKFDSRIPGHRQGSPNYFMIPQPNHNSYRSFSISQTDHIHGSATAHTRLLSIICRFALAHNWTGDLESARMHTGGMSTSPEYNPDIPPDSRTANHCPALTGSAVMPLFYNMHRTHTHRRIT